MKAIDVIVKIFKVLLFIGSIGLGVYFLTLGEPKLLIWVVGIYIGLFILKQIIRNVVYEVLKEYKLIGNGDKKDDWEYKGNFF